MKSVSHIFGGEAKVKIMRLFIFNPTLTFSPIDVASRAKEKMGVTRKELRMLTKAGLIKRRTKGFILDSSCIYLEALENFLIDATPITTKEITKKVSRTGNIKLILVSGVFLHDRDSRIDILVVGDRLKQAKLLSVISSIEAELGRELRYAAFETADFEYRLGIYDKFVRDILDYPHEKVLNKLGI
jgi:predicted nucleotidyltransferase